MEKQGANNLLVRPNLVAYVTAISAWARTSCGDNNIAASHAEFILNRMIDLYYNHETLELPALDGDIVNANHDAPFNSVITCYARCADPNSTERAFAILERLIVSPIQPTVTTFNSVLDVCAKHGEPDRALDVLNKMKEMSIRPDSTSYDTVLNAFGRCSYPDSANKAYDFLCKLENSPDEYNNYKPSILSYSTVINAFARVSGKNSSHGGLEAVKKAKEIYDRLIYQMENGLIQGIVDPFANSCLLNCCANVYGCESDKKAALVIAVSISSVLLLSSCFRFRYMHITRTDAIIYTVAQINSFEEMKKRPELHGEPNQYTFGTMMKVCARLSMDDDEKHRLMENLFLQACKRGACSKAVIGQFLRNTPTASNMNVILSLGGTKRDIPHSWYRNVARRQRPTLM
jgi:pentatricopeptide repeat protein